MASAVKTCRVCGRAYEACRTMMNAAAGVFRWREVACSPECGAEYLRRISESRSQSASVSKCVQVDGGADAQTRCEREENSYMPVPEDEPVMACTEEA